MKKQKQPKKTLAPAPEPPMSFTVDEIVREFSERDYPKKTPEEREKSAMSRRETMRFQPIRESSVPQPEASAPQETPAEKPKKTPIGARLKSAAAALPLWHRAAPKPTPAVPETTKTETVPPHEPPSAPSEPEAAKDSGFGRLLRSSVLPVFADFADACRSAQQKNERALSKPEPPLKKLLAFLLTFLSSLLAICHPTHGLLPFEAFSVLSDRFCALLCFFAMALTALLAWRCLLRGVLSLLHGKFIAETALVLMVAVSLLRAGKDELPCVVSLLLLVQMHSRTLLVRAKDRTLASLEKMTDPCGIVSREADGAPTLAVRDGGRRSVAECAAEDAPTERTENRSCALYAALSLALALIAATRFDRDFLWAWQVMLVASFPLGGLYGYAASFFRAASQLGRLEAAVGGFKGARLLTESAIALTDADLFPSRSARLNGAKYFGGADAVRILEYAAALLEATGAGIASLFDEERELHGGTHHVPSSVRVYEMGGIGGEIRNDIVLIGSARFLRGLEISVPKQSEIPGALYVAVNGEIAALYVLQYKPSEAVKSALDLLVGYRRQRLLLATRDVLLTPEAVGAYYRLPDERLEYPVSAVRESLCRKAEDGECGAALGNYRFVRLCSAVTAAHHICAGTALGKNCARLQGFFGILLTALLTLIGAHSAATGAALFIYRILWLLPVFLGTRMGNVL